MWSNLNETDNGKLVALTNQLLAVNFLAKEKNRDLYYQIRKFENELSRFFKMIGWELVIDERHECVFLHSPHYQFRKRLKKDESIWFLIMSLLYKEKRSELTLSEFPSITLFEIKQKYETFQLPWIGRTALENLIRMCSKYHLMDVVNGTELLDESRFLLYHTWKYVIQEENLSVLGERVMKYTNNEGEANIFEMVEKSEVN